MKRRRQSGRGSVAARMCLSAPRLSPAPIDRAAARWRPRFCQLSRLNKPSPAIFVRPEIWRAPRECAK
jgi:hypothetical protein